MDSKSPNHKALGAIVNLWSRTGVYNWLKRVSTIIYPPQCLLCGASGQAGRDLCAACEAELPWNNTACPRCALPLPAAQAGSLCGQCLTDPPPFEHSIAALCYGPVPGWLVTGLKFHGQLPNARLLAALMWRQLEAPLAHQPGSRPDIIMPVPMHTSRLRERGFNQAVELARPLAKWSGIALDTTGLEKHRPTEQQSELPLSKRRRNVRNAFRCRRNLAGHHVVLVDDVMTSGSTVDAAASVLKRAGAARVSVWVATRTPLN